MYDLLERASGTKQDFKPFWVQLTAYDSGTKYYTWTEQQFIPSTGLLSQLEGGRFGNPTTNPVFDANGTVFSLPIFVQVALANFDPSVDWRYATLGISSSSSTPTFNGASCSIPFQHVGAPALNPIALMLPATFDTGGYATATGFTINQTGYYMYGVSVDCDFPTGNTTPQPYTLGAGFGGGFPFNQTIMFLTASPAFGLDHINFNVSGLSLIPSVSQISFYLSAPLAMIINIGTAWVQKVG